MIYDNFTDTETLTKTQTKVCASDDWLCARCLNKITSEKERFFYEQQSDFFLSNPAGIEFTVITFEKADGCFHKQDFFSENTWFPKHAWAFCFCAECEQQLGWFYKGKYEFYGLIRTKLVQAAQAYN